ncbi:CPBP family intramembrane metalloprotease [Salipaludibacillus keqinensis]|uniref:CPBP family intramembrane metalloprotease n=1 Tax=Salipaludibacillus keqinensis TaxID=2045207 RepID=A0A323T8G7_9BACI|nr:type II CAAX endopeptidase family protein [Salipaludibacillus keqinensis]PYZ92162.1 CPBP family intramembrane metalloprotease [Salipaludibacillus keqinensis]
MTKKYWLILITFILMQVSPLAVILILLQTGFSGTEAELQGMAIFIAFTLGFLIISWIALRTKPDREFIEDRADVGKTVLWSILGIFMAFAAQYAASIIEVYLLGIEPGSENTEVIVDMATAVPYMIIVVAVFVPIMEELVFRMVIFGSLYKRFGFWIAAIVSGLIFAIVHWDFEHLLVYLAMGIVFAFLYVKTKRIIVPIIAHVGINSFVMLVQVIYGERLQEFIEQMEELEQTVQAFIGGLFL